MGVEIERKFLVTGDDWREAADGGTVMCQAYLSTAPEANVRVRIAGERAWLTVKGRTEGLSRPEFEYAIPVADAQEMLTLSTLPAVEKTRYRVAHAGHVWEVDVFAGASAPLVLAEVELASADEAVDLPAWVGDEVSDDLRYRNSQLARHPFSRW